MQVVAVLAGDAHGVALDAGLHLHFAIFDVLDDLFRQLDLHPHLDRAIALDLVAADFLDLVADFQALDIHAALGQLAVEDFLHLIHLELVVGVNSEHHLSLLDARIGTLEVEARADFLVGLFDRILDFSLFYFGNDVERGHEIVLVD